MQFDNWLFGPEKFSGLSSRPLVRFLVLDKYILKQTSNKHVITSRFSPFISVFWSISLACVLVIKINNTRLSSLREVIFTFVRKGKRKLSSFLWYLCLQNEEQKYSNLGFGKSKRDDWLSNFLKINHIFKRHQKVNELRLPFSITAW